MTKHLCYDIITTEGFEWRCGYADKITASNSTNIVPYVVKKQFIFHSSISSPPLKTTLAPLHHSRGAFVNLGDCKISKALGIENWNAVRSL